MHVGLNLIYLVPGETGGMEVYARELIPALAEARPDLRLTAFVNRETAAAAPGPWNEVDRVVRVPVDARQRAQWVWGEQYHLPRLAARAGVDVVHSLASTAPGWGAFRRVTTIHDLIYRLYPEAHFGLRTLGMRVLVPVAARRSHRVIAVSESTRRDLERLLGLRADKIDVTPEGVRVPADEPTVSVAALRERLGLDGRPIALTLSAKRPHKNLGRLLEAIALIDPDRRPQLVLPGYRTPHEAELVEQAHRLGIARDARFLGWVDEETIEGLYAAADVFVFPSLYEGFGLPVLEAMARGVPVACSTQGSLAEVASDAALLFDAHDPRSIADAIEVLLTDPRRARELSEAGRRQAGRFDWPTTARLTVASYERALDP